MALVAAATKSTIVKVSLYLLHYWLGYLNYDDGIKIVNDSNYIKLTNKDQPVCQGCLFAKLHRTPSRTPQRRAPTAYHTVHVDTTSNSTIGYNGHIYAAHLCEDKHRVREVLTTREKHLLGQEVTRFDKQIQSLYGIKLAIYRMDNGTEYCLFQEHCKDTGMIIETSAPHALEQDGVAE